MSTLSLIIPAHNESALLPRLLDTVDVARKRFDQGSEAIEVIVADNASTDDTANIATDRGCKVTYVEKRSIAAARNAGAHVAQGDILCFVDADMQIAPETFNVVSATLDRTDIIAGSTGGWPERWSMGIAVTYAALAAMLILYRMDTGVVFCRRQDFDAVGGYDESRLIGEDVVFLVGLRLLGKKCGKRLIRAPEVKAIVSTRKFDQHGDWYFIRMMPTGICSVLWPSMQTKIANRFWYADDR